MSSSPPTALPSRSSDSHKGTFGRVMLVGGSRGMAGSIALSSIAALHSGSGLASAVIPDCILDTVACFHPAIMTIPMADCRGGFSPDAWPQLRKQLAKQDAVGVGPGMSTGNGSIAIVEGLLGEKSKPLVIDADALNVISQQHWLDGSLLVRHQEDAGIVLTPHRGELARLTGVPAGEPEKQDVAAIEIAGRFGITIVIKGGPTRVVSGCGFGGRGTAMHGGNKVQDYINTTGNPGMATGGSGDVLTGIITSLLGQGLSGWNAARLGVWVHGLAGDEAARRTSEVGMTALHLVETLASVSDQMHLSDSVDADSVERQS
ncbi:NAD(P)H-hydrate dehydratase [Neorhodopirellula lusitana]|uniref:NAD(P)H-hydrate dehydratase n=1 Tax=Neorhodopirellula lusitana TaxID=445327 RepID=UPI00384DFD26